MNILLTAGFLGLGLILILQLLAGWIIVGRFLATNSTQLQALGKLFDFVTRRLVIASISARDEVAARTMSREVAVGERAHSVAEAIQGLRDGVEEPPEGPGPGPTAEAGPMAGVTMFGDEGPFGEVPAPPEEPLDSRI